MKIGHYSVGMWANGGIATYIRRISQAQRERGHEIFFFDVNPIEKPGDPDAAVTVATPDFPTLYQKARELKLDILHAHSRLEQTHTAGLPLIRTAHAHEPYCPSGTQYLPGLRKPCERACSILGCTWGHLVDRCGSRRPLKILEDFQNTWAEQKAFRIIHSIAISQFTHDRMLREGCPPNRIDVLYAPGPPIRPYTPPPREGTPHFVFLGRMSVNSLKGLDWLLESLQHVNTSIHLDVAGDGIMEPQMRALADQLGVSNKVTFHGWKSPEAVTTLLHNARALIFPSVWHEPFGVVSLDAMASGRAVIASRVGGIPEVVRDGITGLLANAWDTPALAAAIDRLSRDFPLACQLGEHGRQELDARFNLATYMEQLHTIYSKCINQYKVEHQ